MYVQAWLNEKENELKKFVVCQNLFIDLLEESETIFNFLCALEYGRSIKKNWNNWSFWDEWWCYYSYVDNNIGNMHGLKVSLFVNELKESIGKFLQIVSQHRESFSNFYFQRYNMFVNYCNDLIRKNQNSVQGNSSGGLSNSDIQDILAKAQGTLGKDKLIGRVRGDDKTLESNINYVSTFLNKNAYKQDAIRVHWKGKRGVDGTTGVPIHITKRDKKDWSEQQKKANRKLGGLLTSSAMSHGNRAEISHALAGSNYGPNDTVSAHPASAQQNTEWLAIEKGLKKLVNANKNSDIRSKITNYVDPKTGFLKSARYKIYIDGEKKFDHISMGNRGDIGLSEANFIMESVEKLQSKLDFRGVNFKKIGGVSKAPRPTFNDIVAGRQDSSQSPLFTDIRLPGSNKRLTRQDALDYMKKIYENY